MRRPATDGSVRSMDEPSADRTSSGLSRRAFVKLAAIVAAELGADWSAVRVEHAEPGPDFDDMGTSGSSSIPDSWTVLRTAAAAARMTFVAAASARWRVSASECDTENGFVVHRATKRRASFGSLVGDVARVRVPKDAVLRTNLPLLVLAETSTQIPLRLSEA